MTPERVLAICKEKDLFHTPELNDKLFLHYQGFEVIEGLEAYVNVKALWLEGNGLQRVQGLAHMRALTCLYLMDNALETLEGIEETPTLTTVNVSGNLLESLDHIGALTELTTLTAAGNRLTRVDGLEGCTKLSMLDLSKNRITDADALLAVLEQLPLRCLYLKGNPVVAKIPNYRRTLVALLPELNFLDDRPVFENERALAEAYLRGGRESEREMRYKLAELKRSESERSLAAWRRRQQEAKEQYLREKAEEEAAAAEAAAAAAPAQEAEDEDEENEEPAVSTPSLANEAQPWSATIDEHLLALLRKHLFDFACVGRKLHRTAESCRLRYAVLESQQ